MIKEGTKHKAKENGVYVDEPTKLCLCKTIS